MKRKEYESPTTKVVMLKQRARLLAGSDKVAPNSASIDDYEDGVFSW